MDTSRWRIWARRAAWLDLVFTAVELALFVAILIILKIYDQNQAKSAADDNTKTRTVIYTSDNEPTKVQVADSLSLQDYLRSVGVLAITSLYFGVQFWAGIKLLRSTDAGREVTESLQMSKVWLVVTIILIAIETVADLFRGLTGLVILLIVFAINAGFFFIVCNFRKELKVTRGQLLV